MTERNPEVPEDGSNDTSRDIDRGTESGVGKSYRRSQRIYVYTRPIDVCQEIISEEPVSCSSLKTSYTCLP